MMQRVFITLTLVLVAVATAAAAGWGGNDPKPRDFMGCEMGVASASEAEITIGKEGVAHETDSTGNIVLIKPMYAGWQYDEGMMSFEGGRLARVQLYRHTETLQEANDLARELAADLERRYGTQLQYDNGCYHAQAAGMSLRLALSEDNQDSWMVGLEAVNLQ